MVGNSSHTPDEPEYRPSDVRFLWFLIVIVAAALFWTL